MEDHLAEEAQQLLAEASLPAIFDAYDEAVADGVSEPVVILIDCQDELGEQIARSWLGDDVVDEALGMELAADDRDDDAPNDRDTPSDPAEPAATTVFAAPCAMADCRGELGEAFPYLCEFLDGPPPADSVVVICITAGGASALTAPMDARPA
ncbi:MAG: hypothetical protein AAF790_04345 [Planctomycetota bacterium]